MAPHHDLSLEDITLINTCLSSEHRLRILNAIKSFSPICQADIHKVLDFESQRFTSSHLAFLTDRGIIGPKKYGKYTFYKICSKYNEVIKYHVKKLKEDPVFIQDKRRYKHLKSKKELVLDGPIK